MLHFFFCQEKGFGPGSPKSTPEETVLSTFLEKVLSRRYSWWGEWGGESMLIYIFLMLPLMSSCQSATCLPLHLSQTCHHILLSRVLSAFPFSSLRDISPLSSESILPVRDFCMVKLVFDHSAFVTVSFLDNFWFFLDILLTH